VASFHPENGGIVINRGTPREGRAGVTAMTAGFFADVPDLNLTCDGLHVAGSHLACLWTFIGHHAVTRNPLRITGWEEWDLNATGKVAVSRGWFDAADYARQVG